MRYKQPLKKILRENRSVWDVETIRPAVRSAFIKTLDCGTAALGAEVYASPFEERTVFHTCKGRACPSCGTRATSQWQRERWAALPDVRYKGITFTMPDVLWPFFRNRQLAKLLPVLAARTVESWTRARFGVRVGVIAILHTFNSRLGFNAHVHIMVTSAGLDPSGNWHNRVYFDVQPLTHYWRKGVIQLLRAGFHSGVISTEASAGEVDALLMKQEQRWWNVKVQLLGSKEHFLRYAGRYARRPPIAQRRITHISTNEIRFQAKDRRLGRAVTVRRTPCQFIADWAQHIPDRYEHAVLSFGLFAPNVVAKTSTAILALLGRRSRPRPKPLRWNLSIKRDFGWDPLIDSKGQPMRWNRRISPAQTSS